MMKTAAYVLKVTFKSTTSSVGTAPLPGMSLPLGDRTNVPFRWTESYHLDSKEIRLIEKMLKLLLNSETEFCLHFSKEEGEVPSC